MMRGITGYFAFSFVLASSLLSNSPSEAKFYSSSDVYLNSIHFSSSSTNTNIYSSSPSPSPSSHEEEVTRQKRLAANILLLLGTEEDVSRVDDVTAGRIRSCFKFFVSPTSTDIPKFLWSTPIKKLAQEAVNYVGDPRNFIHSFLNQRKETIPDDDGTVADGQLIPTCHLTYLPYGQSFKKNVYNIYFSNLFQLIASEARAKVGSTVKLNRYDLFHGHMFLAPETKRIGILFHAQEYPPRSEMFNVSIDNCQGGFNDMEYNQNNMNLRNILWLAPLVDNSGQVLAPGVLVALDAHQGGIIYENLVINQEEYQKKAFTVDNDDFGFDAGNVEYLNIKANFGDADNYKLYICQSFRHSSGVSSE